jgi:hypothetical protein
MFAEWEEADGRQVQFWEPRRGRRQVVRVQLYRDGRGARPGAMVLFRSGRAEMTFLLGRHRDFSIGHRHRAHP